MKVEMPTRNKIARAVIRLYMTRDTVGGPEFGDKLLRFEHGYQKKEPSCLASIVLVSTLSSSRILQEANLIENILKKKTMKTKKLHAGN